MAWTTPKTWLAGAPLGASELNTHLRDNLLALKTPPTALHNITAPHSTSSTSWAYVDGTNLSLTITTTGGDILVSFVGSGSMNSTGNVGYMGVALDGVDVINGGLSITSSATYGNLSFTLLLQGVAAGSHTVSLRYKVSGGTLSLLATGQFFIREAT